MPGGGAKQTTLATPLGPVTLTERDGAIVSLDWGGLNGRAEAEESETPLLAAAAQQLSAYFDGKLKRFDLPLAPTGTRFMQAVWEEMRRIPYGATASYGALAHAVDSGPRAIGMACARNPMPILIPCHRVLAGGGKIGGYSGHHGLDTKRALLALEGVTLV